LNLNGECAHARPRPQKKKKKTRRLGRRGILPPACALLLWRAKKGVGVCDFCDDDDYDYGIKQVAGNDDYDYGIKQAGNEECDYDEGRYLFFRLVAQGRRTS